MTEETHDAPPLDAAQIEPSHLVLLDDAEGFRKGMLVPNAPDIAARLSGKTRPATPVDLGVAGIVTRKA